RQAGLYKGLIFLGAVLLAASLFIITNVLVGEVRKSARTSMNLSVEYYRSLLLSDNPELAWEAIQAMPFPIVVTDDKGNPTSWRNLDIAPDDTSQEAKEMLRKFIADTHQHDNRPIAVEVVPGQDLYFHFGDPSLVSLLRWVSVLSALAVALYVFIGYVGFRTIRKAEERSVWVGMARETAHQLGTPISSLMGWLDVLEGGDETSQRDAVQAMRQDISRLEKISVRFGKIGAREKLHNLPVVDIIEETVRYMRTRVGTAVTIETVDQGAGEAALQPELIGWVLENLLRNAAQAISGKGKIVITLSRHASGVVIDMEDTGVGIAARNFETIFRPGFTTKTRGWGLGLSLSRRIVEEMHRGRLYILNSRPSEGTTIRMVLPT
ncbi:MAG: HAMP domain-containing sensor histidine kinase, partial [bacterium]